MFSTAWGRKVPPYCLRFAHPAEANYRLEAWKLGINVQDLDFWQTEQLGNPSLANQATIQELLSVDHEHAHSWTSLGRFMGSASLAAEKCTCSGNAKDKLR